MADVYARLKLLVFSIFLLLATLLNSPSASAFGIDLLGEVTQPLIAPAKEKMKGILVYIWLQPYAGYGWGTSNQSRIVAGGAVTSANDLAVDGFLYGGRGGLLLFNSLRVGLDYSAQSVKRETLVDGTVANTFSRQSVKGKSSMIGATLGFDIPFTPIQGSFTKFYKATIKGDGASDGDGLGGGISFVLKNPFIFSLEMRNIKYASAADPSGKKAEASYKQYYTTLSFSLF